MINVSEIAGNDAYLRGWRKATFLATLLLVSIVSQIDRILPFILAESIKKDLGLSDTQLGMVTGLAFAMCYTLAALPLARISDRGGAKKVLVCCIVIWTLMTALAGLANSFLILVLLRIGVALGEAGSTPASHFLIGQRIPELFRGRAIGLFSMGIPMGTMLGFALGGWAGDHIGWRSAFFAAGAFGLVLALSVTLFVPGNGASALKMAGSDGFLSAGKKLLKKPAFVWLFVAANLLGFASAPFYVFSAPFLIRTYGLTASEVGLRFGLMQGLLGIAATLLGGRFFDRAIARHSSYLLGPPAVLIVIAAFSTVAALFMPTSNWAIALLVPGMFSFAFLLPYAFGSGHLVAGNDNKALSTGLLLFGSSLFGPSLAPVLVGFVSDFATASKLGNGLRWALLIGPMASVLCAGALLIANKKIAGI
jgi:predicted MFS family arabinose efflux permease